MRPLSFSIANFKSFGSKSNEIPLRPITLIFGPNSAGKSSLLQALMYFHEVMESGELDVITPRSGSGRIDLGGFKQVLHRRGGMRHIVIGFSYPPEIVPKEARKWWPMKQGFTINLTLGPLSFGGDMGTKGISLEIDGRELLRASRNEDGPMKIDLFDFEHPVMSNLFAFLSNRQESDPEDWEEEMADEADREYHRDGLLEYFNYAILRGCYQLETDELFPRTLKLVSTPDVDDTPDKDAHIRMTLFQSRWKDHLPFFMEEVLPDAFKALFSAFKGYTRTTLSSIRHVPPLRDLPPRVFDLNQHPDPLWRRIANQPKLRQRINGWLGADFMKTRYELQVREYAPLDEITSRVPDALDSQMMALFQREGFGSEIDSILNDLSNRYEEMDRVGYVNSHPGLFEQLIDGEIDSLESWAHSDAPHGGPDGDFLLLPKRDKRQRAIELIEDILANDHTLYPQVWEHYQQNSPELREFLSEHWDPHKAADGLLHSIIPAYVERRKEIALAELPANIKVSLQDVGVGISQVLPVLMNAFGEEDSLIAVEQPEIHIHPALQAELADVFLESALGGNRNTFLLETHSEHLILRILRRIRETTEGEMGDWPDVLKKACPNGIRPVDVAVLYVQPGEEGAEVIELPVTADGDFSRPWPSGFFTERSKELY
jgi:hypothetical protein